MNIAICDDLKTERERIITMLREYMASRGLAVDFAEFDSGEALVAAFHPGAFDLIFLDVYMDGMNGIETAKRLKTADPGCVVVFTTTSAAHGADAFDVEALHYLVKPIGKEKLFAVMDKWYSIICEVRTITLKCGRTARDVYINDILYIDVRGRNSTVHTETEVIETPTSLAALEAALPAGAFVRPIRYCIVALRHVKSTGQETLTLDNGVCLAMSRLERGDVKAKFADYKLRMLRRR